MARKMVLVPEEMLKPTVSQITNPEQEKVSDLDRHMKSILESNISDHEKMKKYQDFLNKFLTYNKKVEHPEDENTFNIVDKVIGHVPINSIKTARKLIQYLEDNPNHIRWNQNGEVMIEGRTLDNVYIVDLINDAVSQRVKESKGSQEFYRILNQIHVPNSLILNRYRQKGNTPPTPPQLKRPKRKIPVKPYNWVTVANRRK